MTDKSKETIAASQSSDNKSIYEGKSKTIDQLTYDAAFANDITQVATFVASGGSIDMALMGAHDGKHQELCWWTLCYGLNHENNGKQVNYQGGACFLWILAQKQKEESIIVSKYNKNISMLKGPGEVPRGTFKDK